MDMSLIRFSLFSLLVTAITYAILFVPNIIAQLVSVVLWSISVAFLIQQQSKHTTYESEEYDTHLHYSALEEDEIRLLILESDPKTDGKLKGKLVTQHLSTGPEYTAVSYHWGDGSKRQTITIDGVSVQISENLAAGLRQLRAHSKLALWVDRICLNRSSSNEMSTQVIAMSTIYRKAREVAIWLGPSDAPTDVVFEKLNQPSNPELGVGITLAELRNIIDRPVWSRLWVVQEISASSNPRLYCGSNTLEWIGFARLIRNANQTATINSSGIYNIQNIINFHAERLDSKKVTLLDALCRTSHCKTFEPSDRVFGLLGMVLDSAQYVDATNFYERNRVRLCQRMAERHMKQMLSLDIIFLGPKTGTSVMPSWCPDFTSLPSSAVTRSLSQYVSGTEVRFRMARQAMKWAATGSAEFGQKLFRVERGVLKVSGVPLTSIESVVNSAVDVADWQVPPSDGSYTTSAGFRKFWSDSKTRSALYELCTTYSDTAISDGERQFIRVYERTTTMLSFARFWESVDSSQQGPQVTNDGNPLTNAVMNTVRSLLAEGLRLMSTSQGMPGWVHPAAETSDEIWLIEGCSMPVVLRKRIASDADQFQIIGHCYLGRNIMFGDFWRDAVAKGLPKSVDIV